MSLTAARKPKQYQLKRGGSHHRHTKSYLKPYWPYMPLLLVLATGYSITKVINQASVPTAAARSLRLQILTSSSMHTVVVLLTLFAALSLVAEIIRHGVYFRQLAKSSEAYIYHHASLDILLIAMLVFGVVYSRSAGIIG